MARLVLRKLRVVIVLAALASRWSRGAARSGDLDLRFGRAGKVQTKNSSEAPRRPRDRARPARWQDRGRRLHRRDGRRGLRRIPRYDRDGSLDPTFGDAGKVTTDLSDFDHADAVALQPDGKIVVAGSAFRGSQPGEIVFGLARYNRDGSLDTGFGTGGKVVGKLRPRSFDGARTPSPSNRTARSSSPAATSPPGDSSSYGTTRTGRQRPHLRLGRNGHHELRRSRRHRECVGG